VLLITRVAPLLHARPQRPGKKMGCTQAKHALSDKPSAYPVDAFVLRIDKAHRVPAMDLTSESDPYVRVRSQHKTLGRTAYKNDDPDPVWNEVLDVTGVRLEADLEFELWDKDFTNMNDRIGMAKISVRDLIKRPSIVLLLNEVGGSGDFVVKKSMRLPTELHVSVIKVPAGWPAPQMSPFFPDVDRAKFPKHVLFLTRGTRGDVQPYVALARGLAQTHGWCVTICTELRYKDFVVKNATGLSRGAVRFRPSGGDTHSRIDKPIARWAMAHQSELMQIAMLARTEREFFASEPIMYYWCDMLRPDALVYGFTMANIAMILSEKFQIPCVGFILQPTSIPSAQYPPVASIDTHMISYLDKLERAVTNHDFNQRLKKWMEDDPIWTPLSKMREGRGLRPFKGPKSETFSLLLEQHAPIVVPINDVAFGGRPKDWPVSIQMTDFIFLQGGATPQLSKEIIAFIDQAHAEGDPVVAMTFSSMPVSRGDIVASALKIVAECVSHPRVIALSGAKVKDPLSASLSRSLQEQVKAGKILELEGCPFGLLFDRLDALCVHGGLGALPAFSLPLPAGADHRRVAGTTAEAMRAGLPTTVVGVLLMDQRFWGQQCENLGSALLACLLACLQGP
jgi:sterol 3beta-glucosyltransferase